MKNAEDLLSEIRWYYSLINGWLMENGVSSVEKDKADDVNWNSYDDEKYLEYQAEISKMKTPENATLEQMHYVARLVVCGLFERHFGRMTGEFMLGDLGRRIETIIGQINYPSIEKESFMEDFFEISDTIYKDADSYFAKAAKVYSEVFIDNERNIGGRVALADTNWEIQKLNPNAGQTFFRKAQLLNLTELDETDNLFSLTYNSDLLITSIIVK